MGERTLTIIKPDAVERKLTWKILDMIEDNGFKIIAMKKVCMSKEEAKGFYHIHAERDFYNDLTDFMSSGPVFVAVLEKDNCIEDFRKLMGATDPSMADERTIRKLYAVDVEKNSVHGSDSVASASTEIPFFFSTLEIERALKSA